MGDVSRIRFDPLLDYCGVDLQQGRVIDDASLNELKDIVDRRLRALASDTLGEATVSSATPHAFRIEVDDSGKLYIHPGRMYVDGLLAENHGGGPRAFDPVLAEPRFRRTVPYEVQPYFPRNNFEPLPLAADTGRHLVYLDVWQRELTHAERPALIEPALGVDTTTRTQTVWQVRLLRNVGEDVTCATPDEEISGEWSARIQPAAGRLTTHTVEVAALADPCQLPPSGGYRGAENQTYRVEIHEGGDASTATFKWSRTNGSIVTRILDMTADGRELDVVSTGRDDVLCFATGDWVEVLDDRRELEQLPGEMRRATVDRDRSKIVLDRALPGEMIETDAQKVAARNFRIRKWDQRGTYRYHDGFTASLDATDSKGDVPVRLADRSIVLENGVAVKLALDPEIDNGRFRTGDYWVFAARADDASLELLDRAPPRGVHHHYARLALVNFSTGKETDCRKLWPPAGGEDCACTRCVTPESHDSGELTLYKAVGDVSAKGGIVCLAPGTYALGDKPLVIRDARSVRLKGAGAATLITATGLGVAIAESVGVTLENLSLLSGGGTNEPALAIENAGDVRIERCSIRQEPTHDAAAGAVALGGVVYGITVRESLLAGRNGISGPYTRGKGMPYLATLEARFEDNAVLAGNEGIALGKYSVYFGLSRVTNNFVLGCTTSAISLTGHALQGSGAEISGNRIYAIGTGIATGIDGARILDNDVTGFGGGGDADGIAFVRGNDLTGSASWHVVGNRVRGSRGDGIAVDAKLDCAMIKQNVVRDVGRTGISVRGSARARVLSIENNQLADIAANANEIGSGPAGIRVLAAGDMLLAGNTIRNVARNGVECTVRSGIHVVYCEDLRISGNDVCSIGPRDGFRTGTHAKGILVTVAEQLQVSENHACRDRAADAPDSAAGAGSDRWAALEVFHGGDAGTSFGKDLWVGALDGALLATLKGIYKFPLRRGRWSIRSNILQSRGEGPTLVVVGQQAETIVTDNHVELAGTSKSSPAALCKGTTVIASANRVRGATARSLEIDCKEDRASVVGNIVNRRIFLDHQEMGPGNRWFPFNVYDIG